MPASRRGFTVMVEVSVTVEAPGTVEVPGRVEGVGGHRGPGLAAQVRVPASFSDSSETAFWASLSAG